MTSTVEYPNWFKVTGETRFERHLSLLAGRPGLRFLQIGVFTGDASMWLLDNILTGAGSLLVDVDTWQGSAELAHEAFDWADVERYYDERTCGARTRGRLCKWKGFSEEFFAGAIVPEQARGAVWGNLDYDFIYIDGAHDTDTALTDAENAFQVLKVGGLLAFDDYGWGTVAAAVNGFADEHRGQLEPVELTAQAWFRRTA